MLKIKEIIKEIKRKRKLNKYKLNLEMTFKQQPTEDEIIEIIANMRKVNSNVYHWSFKDKNLRK